MLGGTDVIFETVRRGFDVRSILDAVLEIWPDGLFQGADEEGARRLTGYDADEAVGTSREFFVYKDRASADSWAREGWTEKHGNDLAHFLVADDAAGAEGLQLTLVIGSATGDTVRLVAAVLDALGRMSAGESGARRRPRRVDWDADLRAVGYTSGRDQFHERVRELSTVWFPDWTPDELACHPHEALQFCETVRRVVAPVPDLLVMKALMTPRRQGKKDGASVEPRMQWGA